MIVTEVDDRAELQTAEVIAELAWETHSAWQNIIGEINKEKIDKGGDLHDLEWLDLTDNERKQIIDSVQWLIDHPSATMAQQHDRWRSIKTMDDPDHPNLVPFEELPFAQQMKARLFRHIVLAVLG